jgi:hypothetical protein
VPTRTGQSPLVPPAGADAPSATTEAEVPEADSAGSVPDEHRSPYTWLQILGLVTVAFVLGVLIYFALVQGGDGDADGAPPVPSSATLLVPSHPAASSPETGA